MLGLNGFRDRYNELKPSVGSSIQSASQERILGFYPELGFAWVSMRADATGAMSRSVDCEKRRKEEELAKEPGR